MDSHISQAFQKELTCLICLTYLTDPVTIGCGHSFCRPYLYLSWKEAETPAKCPTCRGTSQNTGLKTNNVVKNLVSCVRQEHLCQFVSSEEHLCRTHKETKKIFCEENENLLCLLCSKSQEHETHNHSSIEWAAENYREKLLKQMRSLWEEIQQTQRNLNEENRTADVWMDFRDIPKKSESAQLCMPQPVSPELSAGPITGLRDRLSRYQVNISFNNETTNHNIMLFDDVRRWRFGHDHQDTAFKPKSSNYAAAWGTKAVTSGKRYWELGVDGSRDWALIVCRDSWVRKKDTLADSEDIFLLLCVKEHSRCRLFTTAPMLCQCIQTPHGRVGVFVDCESGSVSFFNVTPNSLIWRCPPDSFRFPLRPFLLIGHSDQL